MNKKLVLATVATIAAVATAGGVKADEVQGTTGTGNEASTVATAGTGTTGAEKNEATQADKQPTAEIANSETGSQSNDSNKQGNATQFSKHDNIIQVTNPKVVVEQPEGNGRYTPFKVKYEDIKIPDEIAVNEGDKVTFDLPEEVKFQTSYEFDVHNPENAVVGKATADATTNKVTTVFNDYFKNHPLNKSMSLELDASWTDKVVPGKPVTASFNGTLVTANVGDEGVIGKDELIAKWGEQDKEDPTVINWTARVNYAKRVLNYVTIIDEMSENQKLVDNYFEIKNIESVNPWVDKGSAMDLVKSINKTDHGFEIKMDRLDHMIYLYYKTKLVNAVKDSTNPTNKIELKAENDGAVSYQKIQLVGGKGDAVGENKPVWEIPNDAPKYEKPSIDLNDIPLMPPAPIVEIPEWKGGVTPPDAPQLDKPEWSGGVVPFDAPILDKPEINIEDIPLLPPAPVLDKPELIIDIPEPKQDKPNTPNETTDKPNTPAPKVEEVKIVKSREKSSENHAKKESEETVEAYNAPATLPITGSDIGLPLFSLGVSIATLTYVIKKKDD